MVLSAENQRHEINGRMMKVLVTGCGGLLATNTIICLLAAGYRVRDLIRDPARFLLTVTVNLEVVTGDITELPSLKIAAEGCDCIVHAAAETRQGLDDYEDYRRVNVEGTQNVFAAE
jgi:dihydroflavonol-4-reductase